MEKIIKEKGGRKYRISDTKSDGWRERRNGRSGEKTFENRGKRLIERRKRRNKEI